MYVRQLHGCDHYTSEYDVVSEEVSTGADNIQVVVRIRPPCNDEPNYKRVVDVDPSGTQVILRQAPTDRIFSFDHVLDISETQENIFTKFGKKVIENCIAGYNGTIFAYGQTGSGKTFTMLGPSEDAKIFRHEQRGVIPRAFEYLYGLITREKETHGDKKQFLCKCSFLEIYNEQIFDLLEPSTTALQLREGFKTGVYVAGLSERVVPDASEAYEVLSASWMNRRVAATSMNRESSRSHAVFCLYIESKEKKGAVEHIRTSQLNLVDLAGSERQKDTGTTGIRLKEAGSINKSLSNLGNVIMSLVSASRDAPGVKRFIPYRDSKLTFLLRNAIGGNSKTSLIACCHPGQKCFGETLSTLQFAKRAKMIKNKAVQNEEASRNVEQLQAEIRNLKEQLRQMAARDVVTQPSLAAPVSSEDNKLLKEMFITAMMFQQKTDSKKNEMCDEVKKWKEVCEKLDKSMQTNKMIIKFREEKINRLEKKMKSEQIPDTTTSVESDLQEENLRLRVQMDHHPEVARLDMEVHKLRAMVRELRADPAVAAAKAAESDRVQQLLDKYQELLAVEAVQQGGGEKLVTPQRVDSVSSATVEKLRSQVTALEAQSEELKKELADSRKEAEVKLMKLTSELESQKCYVSELEMVRAANSTKSRLEIAALNEKHLQTVKTITTPKKEAYHLRNRVVVASTDSPDLDSTIPFEEQQPHLNLFEAEDGLLASVMATEALQDEIKQLQEEKAELKGRLDEFESDSVKMSSQSELLKTQIAQLEEMFQKERDTLSKDMQKKDETIRKLQDEKHGAEDTARELNLLWAHCDKELKETREKARGREAEMEKLLTKNNELNVDLAANIKQKEKYEEQLGGLEDEVDMLICTNNVRENQIQELEAKLQEADSLVTQLRQEVQLMSAGKPEREARIDMLEKELAERCRRIQELQTAVKETEAARDKQQRETAELISSLRQQMEGLRAEKAELESRTLDLQEQLEDLQESCQSLENSLTAKNVEIQELQLDKERAKVKEVCFEEDIASLREENERMVDEQLLLEEANSKLEAEAKSLKESVETMVNMNEHNKLVYQLESLETLGKQKTEEIEKLKAHISQLDVTLVQSQKQMDECAQQNINKIHSLQDEMQAKENMIYMMNEKYQQLMSSATRMRLDLDEAIRESVMNASENERLSALSLKDKEELDEVKSVLAKIKELYGELTEEELVKNLKTTKEERDQFESELSGIAGHANHKQKIRLHENLKNERDHYRKELTNLKLKYSIQSEKLRELECKDKHTFLAARHAADIDVLKENKKPSHKTFFSGDFTK